MSNNSPEHKPVIIDQASIYQKAAAASLQTINSQSFVEPLDRLIHKSGALVPSNLFNVQPTQEQITRGNLEELPALVGAMMRGAGQLLRDIHNLTEAEGINPDERPDVMFAKIVGDIHQTSQRRYDFIKACLDAYARQKSPSRGVKGGVTNIPMVMQPFYKLVATPTPDSGKVFLGALLSLSARQNKIIATIEQLHAGANFFGGQLLSLTSETIQRNEQMFDEEQEAEAIRNRAPLLVKEYKQLKAEKNKIEQRLKESKQHVASANNFENSKPVEEYARDVIALARIEQQIALLRMQILSQVGKLHLSSNRVAQYASLNDASGVISQAHLALLGDFSELETQAFAHITDSAAQAVLEVTNQYRNTLPL